MCGICGYAGFPRDDGLLARMTERLYHRGPDDAGLLIRDGVGLGMRRLSIIDVAGGHQPMLSEDGQIALVFNGEIYNYRALLPGLLARGHLFRTRSDTEVILHLYEERGIACLEELRGMFALALYDAREGRLLLARDRLGIKPLYYWVSDSRLLFASEIKALLACPNVPRQPSLRAIDAYLRLRYVPGPGTMLEGVYKLLPGHWLRFQEGQATLGRYWAPALPRNRPTLPDAAYQEQFNALFHDTVRLHLESDVAVGVYLSGGLDSSLVAAEAVRVTGKPLHTFSVGFGWESDENTNAREVARWLGTEHHEVTCGPEDLGKLPQLVWHSEEPLGDLIALPTLVLARLARQHVKVALTGEGADEVLAGYLFHRVVAITHALRRALPGAFFRDIGAPLLRRLPTEILDRCFDYPGRLGRRGRARLADYLALAATDVPERLYYALITLTSEAERARLYLPALRPLASDETRVADSASGGFFDRLLLEQYASWLPDNILMRQDKMSMACSVEARVPFLDHMLVEFLLAVPSHLKLQSVFGSNKVLARRRACQLLPAPAARRRKRAFYIPAERYVHHPAFERLLAATLNPQQVKRRGYFEPEAVSELVRAARASREFVLVKQVLSLIMLELWHQIFVDDVKWNGVV